MKFRNMAAAVAALTMTASPVLAADVSRSAAPVAGESQMGGESSILLVLAVVLAGLGIYLLADNGNDHPNSP